MNWPVNVPLGARLVATLVSLLTGVCVVAGCDMTDRKFVSATDVRTESSMGVGGMDGDAGEPDCTIVGCDARKECEEASGHCVECLSDTACAANLPSRYASAAGVCDTIRQECVRCLVDDQCAGATPFCKVDRDDSDLNECVECTVDAQCDPNTPVCNTTTNDCTLRCTRTDECGAEKPVCNTARQLCVECIDDSTCSGATSQCNLETNECVQCVDDGPCSALGLLCDLASNNCACPLQAGGSRMIDCGGGLCIQNRVDACCPAAPACGAARPNCDPTDHVCKECVTASQCPGANRTCVEGVCGCVQGTKPCADGTCVPNDQCCDTCTGGRSCQEGTCACPGDNQQFVNGQCQLNQGETCTPDGTPCLTGPCVDGVCCESACNGVCMQCQAGSGRCIMPADDDACPPETICPASESVCQEMANITADRCQSLGQCKTAANCTASNLPARTACDAGEVIASCIGDGCTIQRICNGAGSCASPTVACLDEPNVVVSATTCCSLGFPSGDNTDPEGVTTFCSPAASGSVTVLCDSQNDCPTGNICCAEDAGNFNSIACRTSCVESTSGNQYRVCRSPGGGGSSCPGGRACNRTHPALTGWAFCAL